jgi:tetratricopeptide (TPR) repeat protein
MITSKQDFHEKQAGFSNFRVEPLIAAINEFLITFIFSMLRQKEHILAFLDKLRSMPDSIEKVWEVISFTTTYAETSDPTLTMIHEEGVRTSKRLDYKIGELMCLHNQQFLTLITAGNPGPNVTGLTLAQLVEKVKEEEFAWMMATNFLALEHWFKGEFDKSFNVIFHVLNTVKESDKLSFAWLNFALGIFYYDTKDYHNSNINYTKAFDIFSINDFKYGMARASNGIASVSIQQNRIPEAIEKLDYSAEIYRELNHASGLSRTLNDAGVIEKLNGNYNRAIELLYESLALRKEMDHRQGLVTTYTELAEVFLLMADDKKALENLDLGLKLSLELNNRQKSAKILKLLSAAHKRAGNIALALECFEKFYEVEKDILSDETTNNLKRIQTKFQKEQSDKITELERFKNVELKSAYDLIEKKNVEILDSIHYAKRIQNALIPNEKMIQKQLERLKK